MFGLSFMTSSIEKKEEAKANDPPLLLMILMLLFCFTSDPELRSLYLSDRRSERRAMNWIHA